MRVAIGSDHAGFQLKGDLCSLLDELRIEYRDFGTFDAQPVDYPDFIAPVARAVALPAPNLDTDAHAAGPAGQRGTRFLGITSFRLRARDAQGRAVPPTAQSSCGVSASPRSRRCSKADRLRPSQCVPVALRLR